MEASLVPCHHWADWLWQWHRQLLGKPQLLGSKHNRATRQYGGTGLSSEQMKQLSTYAGWSINTDPVRGSIWYSNDGLTPPTLH